jgi:hypothetical protein
MANTHTVTNSNNLTPFNKSDNYAATIRNKNGSPKSVNTNDIKFVIEDKSPSS